LSREGASLPWIVGTYYFDDLSSYQPLGLTGQAAAPLDEVQIWSAQRSHSYAAFGQVTPRIAIDTRLTLGLRYTRDERRVNGSTSGLIGPQTLTLTTGSQSVSWSRPTWRVALDHRFAPDIMAYVSADRGFKSGVFNTLTYADAPVAPEILDAYQVGLKTELAEHRVRLNLAAFYYDYRNIQIQEVVTGAIRLVNAAAAKLKGIDVDFAFLPVDPITLRGALEIVSGHYTSFRDAPFYSPILDSHGEPVGGNTQSAGDATGLDTVRTPNETATVTAEYRVALPTGSIKLAASNYYSAGFSWDPDNHLRESHYDVVNVSADYTRREAWNVRLWVKNLTETHYCVDATEETLLNACSPAPPRTYGITVGMHF
jgi:iron complex outermembrane receptor protein